MAIKHKIRNKNGDVVSVKLTFAKAIKYFCIECMGFQQQEVKNCTASLCPLFKYKTGKEEKEIKTKITKKHKDALLAGLQNARDAKGKKNGKVKNSDIEL